MAEYVKFSVPKELIEAQQNLLMKVKKSGKIRVGANETTKAVERVTAKLVFIAEDVNPAEIVMHLPVLCKEKSIPFGYFPTKADLGKAAGISVGTAAIAVTETGDAKKEADDLSKKLLEISGLRKPEGKEEHKGHEGKKEEPKGKEHEYKEKEGREHEHKKDDLKPRERKGRK